jgi:hypothetical protein
MKVFEAEKKWSDELLLGDPRHYKYSFSRTHGSESGRFAELTPITLASRTKQRFGDIFDAKVL